MATMEGRERHPYRSGHCDVGRHERCARICAGAECSCKCHTAPKPVGAAGWGCGR